MGQYYKPVLLRDDNEVIAFAESWTFGNGAKLMEHSWIGNDFVGVIESLLLRNPTRIVWAGDYSDNVDGLVNEEGEGMNFYDVTNFGTNPIKEVKQKLVLTDKRAKYVVNHTTKQFIDKTKVPVDSVWEDSETGKKFEYKIHPLPLMTCLGNGLGGGDYYVNEDKKQGNTKLIGTWAGHEISIETRKPRGYQEVIFDLIETGV